MKFFRNIDKKIDSDCYMWYWNKSVYTWNWTELKDWNKCVHMKSNWIEITLDVYSIVLN